MMRAMILGVTRAEVQAVRIFVVGAVRPKISKVVAFETGFPIVGVVKV